LRSRVLWRTGPVGCGALGVVGLRSFFTASLFLTTSSLPLFASFFFFPSSLFKSLFSVVETDGGDGFFSASAGGEGFLLSSLMAGSKALIDCSREEALSGPAGLDAEKEGSAGLKDDPKAFVADEEPGGTAGVPKALVEKVLPVKMDDVATGSLGLSNRLAEDATPLLVLVLAVSEDEVEGLKAAPYTPDLFTLLPKPGILPVEDGWPKAKEDADGAGSPVDVPVLPLDTGLKLPKVSGVDNGGTAAWRLEEAVVVVAAVGCGG
jgi:hypothetical protein